MEIIAATASTWTVIGILGAFAIALLTITWKRMDRLEVKIEAQGRELRDEMKAQGKDLSDKIAQQGREISEIKGMVKAVLELVPHPSAASHN
jgi:hypothetical protein